MVSYCLGLLLLTITQSYSQQYHSCRVPTYCRRTPGGAPEAIYTDLQGNVIVEPTPPPRPGPSIVNMAAMLPSSIDPNLSDAEKVQVLSNQVASLSQPGWFVANNGYQYWVSSSGTFVDYDTAKVICQGYGATVATVGMRDDNARQYIVDNILRRCGDTHAFWIGYTDITEEGSFVWEDGITDPNSNPDWQDNQPDNINNADCTVTARDRNYQWDDVPCAGSKNGVLCERKI